MHTPGGGGSSCSASSSAPAPAPAVGGCAFSGLAPIPLTSFPPSPAAPVISTMDDLRLEAPEPPPCPPRVAACAATNSRGMRFSPSRGEVTMKTSARASRGMRSGRRICVSFFSMKSTGGSGRSALAALMDATSEATSFFVRW